MTDIKIIGVLAAAAFLLHLAGGLHHHARHYRQHGAHPSLRYTYGRGWWGSVSVGDGFRLGHRIRPVRLLGQLATVLVVLVAVAVVAVHHV